MKRPNTRLLVVSHSDNEYRFARYEGRIRTHRWGFALPLSAYWIEEMRNAPQQFETSQAPEAA